MIGVTLPHVDWKSITQLNGVPLPNAAAAYAAAGIPVFPLYGTTFNTDNTTCECAVDTCDRPGKHPRVAWTRNASHDVDRVHEWWAQWPNANIGVPCGQAGPGWMAVDLDASADGVELDGESSFSQWAEQELGLEYTFEWFAQSTLVQRTGGGGWQLVFQHDGHIKSIGRWLPGVDIKGNGGYIAVPPSRHYSGNTYQWHTGAQPAAAPERLASVLRVSRGTVKKSSADGSSGEGGSGGSAEYDVNNALVYGPQPGTRDVFFNNIAFQRRRSGVSKDDTLAELRRIWEVTSGGGQPDSQGRCDFSWSVVEEKVHRAWETVDVEESPVHEEGREWARRTRHLTVVSSGSGDVDSRENPGGNGASAPARGPQSSSGDTRDEDGGENSGSAGTNQGQGGTGFSEDSEDATDMGNGARFARVHYESLRYIKGVGWHIWDGVKWALDEMQRAEHMAWNVVEDIRQQAADSIGDDRDRWARWARDTQGAQRTNAMIKRAESDPRLAVKARDLDADPWMFTVENGTVDLRAGQLRPSRRGDLITKSANVEFDSSAACPRWQEHIDLVTSRVDGTPDPELAAFIQRWAGYTLTGLVSEQKFAFLYGGGSNGKNVIVETLIEVMGSYATVGSAKLLEPKSNEHSTMLVDLMGHRLVFIDETPKGRVDEARLKQLTGSSEIRARKIAQNNITFPATFKIWIAGNHKPRLTDTSEGMWRRLDLVPFDVQIPSQMRVRDYHHVLARQEGSGILNWALSGLQGYLEVGLGQPTRIKESSEEYREEEDVFGQFLHDTFAMDFPCGTWTSKYPNSVIHGLYKNWCESQGIKNVSTMRQITGDLKRAGFEKTERFSIAVPPYGTPMQTRGWIGPALRGELPSELSFQYR